MDNERGSLGRTLFCLSLLPLLFVLWIFAGFTSAYYRFAVIFLSFPFFLPVSFLLLSRLFSADRLTAFFSSWLRAAVTPSSARRWIRSRAALTTSRVGTVTTGSVEGLTFLVSRSRLEDTRRRVRRSPRTRVDAINFPIHALLVVEQRSRATRTHGRPVPPI